MKKLKPGGTGGRINPVDAAKLRKTFNRALGNEGLVLLSNDLILTSEGETGKFQGISVSNNPLSIEVILCKSDPVIGGLIGEDRPDYMTHLYGAKKLPKTFQYGKRNVPITYNFVVY